MNVPSMTHNALKFYLGLQNGDDDTHFCILMSVNAWRQTLNILMVS